MDLIYLNTFKMKKLTLNKRVIVKLSDERMSSLMGGGEAAVTGTCSAQCNTSTTLTCGGYCNACTSTCPCKKVYPLEPTIRALIHLEEGGSAKRLIDGMTQRYGSHLADFTPSIIYQPTELFI